MPKAVDFTLADQDGKLHSLKDYYGKWLVLYFYPKDDTPGCTTEACNFRDSREVIAEIGHAEVVGISQDSVSSHKAFANKYGLNFTLLSDTTHGVIEQYDSWKLNNYEGKEYMAVQRNTFIIDPKSQIVKKYIGADPQSHAADIIKDLKELQT
jgi:peroxiredoxin Q/BCP